MAGLYFLWIACRVGHPLFQKNGNADFVSTIVLICAFPKQNQRKLSFDPKGGFVYLKSILIKVQEGAAADGNDLM